MTATPATSEPRHEAQVSGELAGRYELRNRIGRGGMADVYRAFDPRTTRDVAVKVFRPGLDPADTPPRMRREFELLSSLQHPGLVEVFDADIDGQQGADGPPFIVMELVEGDTLRDRMRRSALTEQHVVSMGAQLCATLAYVHARGIVHRDVKPANILLPSGAADVRPKLTDFGIARLIDSTRMTAEGFTVGTANYLSPEQVRGSAVGTESDVYALGLILIEALNGCVVFPGHGVEAAIARLSRDPEVDPSVRPELAALLRDMTARDATARLSAKQAGARFERLRGSVRTAVIPIIDADTAPVPTPVPVSLPAGRADPTGRRRFGLVGIAAAVAAAIAGAVILVSNGGTAVPAPSHPAPAAGNPAVDARPSASAATRASSTSPPRLAVPVPVRRVVASDAVAQDHQAALRRTAIRHAAPPSQSKKANPKGNGNGHGNGDGGGNGGKGD
jgi:serine/threonine protein kinase